MEPPRYVSQTQSEKVNIAQQQAEQQIEQTLAQLVALQAIQQANNTAEKG